MNIKEFKKEVKRIVLSILIVLIVLFLSVNNFVLAIPGGAQLSEYRSERGIPRAPNSIPAIAGNVTELEISGTSITRSWQGYFGNVSGTITLDDANNHTLYNWSLASPEGEVYATNGTVVSWTNIQCFNFTAAGTDVSDSAECNETLVGGTTSLCGKNLTQLEEEFGIEWDDVDGVNETFNFTYGTDTHDLFYTGYNEFSAGECTFTRLFGDSGQGENNEFEEVLLWDPDQNNTIFAALLEEDDVLGFDDTPKDFEMIVLENGHGTDTATTEYYFYIEIE